MKGARWGSYTNYVVLENIQAGERPEGASMGIRSCVTHLFERIASPDDSQGGPNDDRHRM